MKCIRCFVNYASLSALDAAVLLGMFSNQPQLARSLQRKTRIPQEPTSDGNQVRLLLLQDLLCLNTTIDQSHGNHMEPRDIPLDLLREGNLVPGEGLDLLLIRVSTRRNVEDIHTGILDPLGNLNRLLNLPGRAFQMLDIIGRRNSQDNRLLGREVCTNLLNNLQQEPSPVLEGSSVVIGTLVGDGGEEAVNEVTVSAMDLDGVHTGVVGPDCCGSKCLDDVLDFLDGELARGEEVLTPGESASRADDVFGPELVFLVLCVSCRVRCLLFFVLGVEF